MEIYDQHEQSERVRSWLKDNASAIVTGVVIGLGAIFGYGQWQNHQARQSHTAAELYERVRVAEATPEAIAAAAATLREDYAGSGFAILASLRQAQVQMAAKDLDGARTSLAWAHEHADESSMKALAGLRLAQVQWAAEDGEAALATLAGMDADAGFDAERAELRGDVLLSLGRDDEARTAYQEAEKAGAADPARLSMKLGEFGDSAEAQTGEGA